MRTPRITLNKNKLAAALAPIALAAGMLAPVAAAKQAPTSPHQAAPHIRANAAPQIRAKAASFELTRGFDVWNFHKVPITLYSVTNADAIQGTAPIGSVLQPGDSQHFEILYRPFQVTETDVKYIGTTASGGDRIVTASMVVADVDTPYGACYSMAWGACTPSDGGDVIAWGTTIIFKGGA